MTHWKPREVTLRDRDFVYEVLGKLPHERNMLNQYTFPNMADAIRYAKTLASSGMETMVYRTAKDFRTEMKYHSKG